MKVIIAGGRCFKGTNKDWEILCTMSQRYGICEIVSGGASGADSVGEHFAKESGIVCKIFPADWSTYGKSAGPIRNGQMAEYADAVILFPGGRGTANMRKLAKEHGLKILYDAEE